METYTSGRADFIYRGQKKGNFEIQVPDIFREEPKCNSKKAAIKGKKSQLEVYKIWEPTSTPTNSFYTNLPSKY